MPNRPKSPVQFVAEDRGYKTPCWIWQRALDGGGYGRVKVGGRLLGAHRYFYERARGPVPSGLQIDHLCRVRPCVNPDHMEPVTHAENGRRGSRAKLDMERADAIRFALALGDSPRLVAGTFGVSQRTVYHIRSGERWAA